MIKHIVLVVAVSFALAGCKQASDNTVAPAANTAQTSTAAAGPSAPPAGSDWTAVVAETPDGGFVMGNPKAPVKLVEYGSLSCPHCAHFAHESHDALNKYVASGKVSYELRTFIIHPQDTPASLLVRCNGAAAFFAMTDQMLAKQDEWQANISKLTAADQSAYSALTPDQRTAYLADKLDLISYFQKRGVPAEKAKACLASKSGNEALQKIYSSAADQYHIPGTPAFILNGMIVADVVDWKVLEPKIKAAIGG